MGLVDAFIVFAMKNLRYPWSHLRRRLCEGRYLETELPSVNSLKDVQDCLKKVHWEQEGLLHLYDSISYPQTVWSKKKDDCDGFAILAAELIQRWEPSLNPVLVNSAVRPLSESHTVCAFKDGDKLAFFDNTRLRRGNYREYADIVAKITKDADRVICWDVVKPDTLEALEFHRV